MPAGGKHGDSQNGAPLRTDFALLADLMIPAAWPVERREDLRNRDGQFGCAVPAGKVEAVNTGTSIVQITQTDPAGSYVFPSLINGTYECESRGMDSEEANKRG